MGLALLAAAMAVPTAAPAQVKMSRSGICHCPGGACWSARSTSRRTLRSTAAWPRAGRHPKQGQGDCDAPGMAAAAATGSSAPRVCDGPCYDRALFGGWADADGDCRSTRPRGAGRAVHRPGALVLRRLRGGAGGGGSTPTRGTSISTRAGSTSTTWCPWPAPGPRGAAEWDAEARAAFANDPANLIPTEARVNRSKGARGPLAWLPPDEGARCGYVLRFARVARSHGLEPPAAEAERLEALRAGLCG